MSDESVISSVGETLITLLRQNMTDIPSPEESIILYSPGELGAETTRLMLFLYAIKENEHMKNQPTQNLDPTMSRYPPLTVDLYYMLTAYPSGETDKTERTKGAHSLLERAMRIFYDNSILRGAVLKGCFENTDVELRLLLTFLPLEEQAQIWNTSGDNALYRLSVFYQVTPVEIESIREVEVHRIVEKVS